MPEHKCFKDDIIKSLKESIDNLEKTLSEKILRNENRLNSHAVKIDEASLDVRGMKVQLENIAKEIANISLMMQNFFKESKESDNNILVNNNKTWEGVFNKGYDILIKLLAILGFILGMKEFIK